MAALFRPPVPDAPAAPAPTPQPPAVDADAAARQARLEALDRRRRGLAGTIAGSAKGFLQAKPEGTSRKTLLGE